ncbi:MAG: beta-lactamase family protein [Vitreoscilla sp.]|nr:beta-lactamase family protein [Vitreoscilla sp.]
MAPVQGHCTERFDPLRQRFASLLASGDDLGASMALTIDGEFVVDLWGGFVDEARTQAWQRDTITHVWSTTKTVTNLAALWLASRGELDLDAPVSRYWPEFAANGKSGVLVRHVLSHTSGVPGWAEPMCTEDLYDWERSAALLAAQSPWWAPGSASGYQAMTHGFLVGELIRRVGGRKTGAFVAEHLAGPLGADFHIGLDPSQFDRVARVVPPPPLPLDFSQMPADLPMMRVFTNPGPDASASWTPAWRQADLGALNGHGHARSVAQLMSIVACGGSPGGRSWLSPAVAARIFETQADGIDAVLGMPMTMGLGYGLPNATLVPYLPAGRLAYWGGWGGSLVVADADRRMCFAYMMNKMAPGLVGGPNVASLAAALYEIVGEQTRPAVQSRATTPNAPAASVAKGS